MSTTCEAGRAGECWAALRRPGWGLGLSVVSGWKRQEPKAEIGLHKCEGGGLAGEEERAERDRGA